MIVCDICKKHTAYNTFSVPKINKYYAMKNGVRLTSFDRLEKTDMVICCDCQGVIARFIESIEAVSIDNSIADVPTAEVITDRE